MSLFNHCEEPTSFFGFENQWAQHFLIWVIFWISIWKLSWVLKGKINVSLENDFWLPKPARSAQIVENSHSFFFQYFLCLIQIFGSYDDVVNKVPIFIFHNLHHFLTQCSEWTWLNHQIQKKNLKENADLQRFWTHYGSVVPVTSSS